jgi:fucose 4-O-acetylase-like acetyltransferase
MTAISATSAPPRVNVRPAKRRVPFWDNARWASITLVVIGHSVQRLTTGSDHALELYIFIYAFHMPAFAIISGYFSKATPPGRRQMIKLVTDILIPYLVLQAIWSLVQYLFEGVTSGYNPAEPHWTLWFLVALAIFRVALPYLVLLRWPLLWAVVFSIGVGYLNSVDSTFALSRAIALLPFFLLGWKLRQWKLAERWLALPTTRIWMFRAISLAVFALWLAIVIILIKPMRDFSLQNWFMYDQSYQSIGTGDWWNGLVRLGALGLGTLLSLAFLTLVPRRNTWFTSFGQATMYVYLLHSFILYPLRETGVLKGEHSDATGLVSIVLCAIAISIALSSPLIRKIFRPLIEPKPLWLFTKEEKPAVESEEATPPSQSRTTGSTKTAGPTSANKMSRVDPTGSRRDR